jgi:hypothetical protein
MGCGASEAKLLSILKTTSDSASRHAAAVDLAGRHSLPATQELAKAAVDDAVAAQGLAALRDEYISLLGAPEQQQLSDKGSAALVAIVDCLTAIGDGPCAEALGGLALSSGPYAFEVNTQVIKALASMKGEAPLLQLTKAVNVPQTQPHAAEISQAACTALLGRSDSTAALIEARAASADTALCSTIDDGLARMGEAAAPALVAALGDDEWTADILYKMGPVAAPAVTAALDGGDTTVRYQALGVLLRLYQTDKTALAPYLVLPGRVPLLVEARSKGYGDERDAALEDVLLQIGKPAVTALVAQLGAADWAEDVLVRAGASAAAQVASLLKSEDVTIRGHALSALLRIYNADQKAAEAFIVSPDVVPLLVDGRTKGYGDGRDVAAEHALAQIGEPAVAPLIALLGKADWAVNVLADIGAPAGADLVTALKSKDVGVGQQALSALLSFYQRDEKAAASFLIRTEAVPVLIEAQSNAASGSEAANTIDSVLVAIGGPAVAPLIALLGKADWAVNVLADIGAPAGAELVKALKSKDVGVGQQALSALLSFYQRDKKAASPFLIRTEAVPVLIEAQSNAAYGSEAADTVDSVLVAIGRPAASALVVTAAQLLTDDAEWTDADLARDLYDLLERFDGATVIDVLVEKVSNDAKDRLHILFLGIKLGIPGSEERLNQLLSRHGNKQMAEDFLNSGSDTLYQGGKQWAERHGYYITSGAGSSRASWGSF